MLTEKSFAKINLYLEITGRTEKGYHLLNSLMALIDIFDLITIENHHQLELKIKNSEQEFLEQNPQENIIIKAVNLLAQNYRFAPNIKITLEKNIPVSAGLGGGSSNAATTLLMLNHFYNLNLKRKELMDLGLKLGADVPFFINAKTSFVSGIGEILKDAGLKNFKPYLLIINPRKPLSTKQAFEAFHGNFSKHSEPDFLEDVEAISYIKNRRNDLEEVSIKIMPEIKLILQEIANQKNCLLSRMSGTGASCFGIFESEKDLDLAFVNLGKIFPNFFVKKARLLSN
ncbi:MAG: 4-diphosphocytidyl-2C-methyl-D-erythritol kinase [Rickettsiaceae bacterium]|jgi:4-diphosphocytidyl-2-C-methyl-D-erythritol kinase|nr:4-diphosphocytidyl-2C-methyl-D-erythritol kinase [Rickettsiaceae bacterium]